MDVLLSLEMYSTKLTVVVVVVFNQAARPKLVAALPQELRKGARNIQFVLDDPPQPVAPSPVRDARIL